MEAELRNLFYASIEAFAESEGVRVSMPNVEFTPPGRNDVYLKVFTLPVPQTVLTVCGGISENEWILQVSIYTRIDTGEIRGLELADKLRAAYPVTHEFTGANHRFKVIRPPSPRPPILMDGWHSIPVRFRVNTFS